MKRSFTLIELLVVITIIAILLSLLLPGLRGAREKSHIATCSSNLRQMGMAMQSFAGDNQGNVPDKISGTQFSWAGKAGTVTTLSVTSRPLNTYLGYRTNGSEVEVARCTKDIKTGGVPMQAQAPPTHPTRSSP
jgi:prepilin-type N-terminal cleavage/methylation domain-containing protein